VQGFPGPAAGACRPLRRSPPAAPSSRRPTRFRNGARVLAQRRRDQKASGTVEFDILGKTDQQAPHHGGFDLQAGGSKDLGADWFPSGLGIEQQAAMRMGGHHQAPFAGRHQGVAMPGGNRHPALGIEVERRRTLKHEISPGVETGRQPAKISHKLPQEPTL
jgi:hypothetical protein